MRDEAFADATRKPSNPAFSAKCKTAHEGGFYLFELED